MFIHTKDIFNMPEIIPLKKGELKYFRNFLTMQEADILFSYIKENIVLEQGNITLFGKTHKIPRLESFHAKQTLSYTYSGKKLVSKPFTNELNHLCEMIEKATDAQFNCVLINLYRNGMDSNGWHADNEMELGKNPIIASLSLGVTRRFDLKNQFENESFSIELHHGDLLLMNNQMQENYKHQIAKSKKITQERINLTFRKIKH